MDKKYEELDGVCEDVEIVEEEVKEPRSVKKIFKKVAKTSLMVIGGTWLAVKTLGMIFGGRDHEPEVETEAPSEPEASSEVTEE